MHLPCGFRPIRSAIAAFFFAAAPAVALAQDAPTDSLQHHWALDESSGTSAADSAGSVTGTLVSGPVWQPASGVFGGALEFDGVNDYVSLGNMDIPFGPGLSISVWMRADEFGTSDARLISKSTGLQSGDHYWMVSTINSTGLRFRLKTGTTTTTLATSNGQVTAGKWYHVVATYDGAMMRIYKDGIEVASTAKTGTPATSGAVGVAIGNQPAGAGSAAFDGLIDDVRIYNRALTPLEISNMSGGPMVELWYGNEQNFGFLGVPQKWANVVGTILGAERVDSLYYNLNGGATSQLNMGPDDDRLAGEGDFNIEIDYADLTPGANDVVITTVDVYGQHKDTPVTLNYMNGVKWARPDTLKFEAATAISDEACVVDGKWYLTTGGVRLDASAVGYDRLLTAGQGYDASDSWPSNLEVLMPLTIHTYVSQGARGAIGIGLGWRGHSGPEQPSLGHWYQAIAFIRDVDSSPVLTLYDVVNNGYLDRLRASTPISVSLGVRYLMRMRSEAISADSCHVSAKVWEDGTTEPLSWQLAANFARIDGSVLLISHFAESTFGNTIITPLTLSVARTAPAHVALVQNVPNPFGDATTLRYALSDASDVEIAIYDVAGRRVHYESYPASSAGWHEYRINASDVGGRPLPAGVYFCRLTALGTTATRKITLVR